MDFLLFLFMAAGLVGVTGLAATWALLKGFRPWLVVAVGTFTMALVVSALFLLGQWGEKQNMVTLLQNDFNESLKLKVQEWSQSGWTQENIEFFKAFFQKYIYLAFPAWLAVNCVTTGLLVYHLASSILSKLTPRVSKGIAFRHWVLPEPLVFGLILGGLLKLYVMYVQQNKWVEVVSNNLLVFFGVLYMLGGLSIISFFLNKWRFPWFVRALSYIALLNLVLPSICAVGILDVWFDFRKMKQTPRLEQPS